MRFHYRIVDALHIHPLYDRCITERAFAVHYNRPIRHSDDLIGRTRHVPRFLFPGSQDDFPLLHLQLFNLVDADFLNCSQGLCGISSGVPCVSWSCEKIQRFYQQLAKVQLPSAQQKLCIQQVDLVASIYWIRE
jgi:hypothetical protein